ncbi:MAG: DUF1801 domain-containing protein [Pseudomonadota bacterium]
MTKITAHDGDVAAFLESVEPAGRREDALLLMPIMERASGETARLWGTNLIGFGSYDYTYKSGHSGTWFRTGFGPGKGKMSVHIMPGYDDYSEELSRLGPYKKGASCLYLGRLSKVDLGVLEEIVEKSVTRMRELYPG